MRFYKALNNQRYKEGNYEIVPIRFEDMFDIMNWRNEQIFHLRQDKALTSEDQKAYFNNVIADLFNQDRPKQILFSYLENGKCIGYGGLVHINWIDFNAEISFIMETALEPIHFEFHWEQYLKLIQEVAFVEIGLHKIYTYAFDLRPRLYTALLNSGFNHEAILKQHCYYNRKFIDVHIHSKVNDYKLRLANEDDLDITYQWATNKNIRKFSFNQSEISYDSHCSWFTKKISEENCYYFILENVLGEKVGSIRFDILNNDAIISYLLDSKYFGRGLGRRLVELGLENIELNKIKVENVIGFVQQENIPSIKIFERLGFEKVIEGNNIKFIKRTI